MKKRAVAITALAFSVPAFAGDLTGYRVAQGCSATVKSVSQDGGNRVHVVLTTLATQVIGKLQISATGEHKVTYVRDFAVNRNGSVELTTPAASGPVLGKDVTLSFTDCKVVAKGNGA